jgi:rubrerythrin
MDTISRKHIPLFSRRRILLAIGVAALLPPLAARSNTNALSDRSYPETVAALNRGFSAEMGAHRRYLRFGRAARDDRYDGIAYLYAALATSEWIHGQNYARILRTLGASPRELQARDIEIATTKENLIYAAERELNSIEKTYPAILKQVKAESVVAAISAVEYSWASHRQHLDLLNEIRRWSPGFFATVARTIDEKTDHYYVCDFCGSTLAELPRGACPVCDRGPEYYRMIGADEFF